MGCEIPTLNKKSYLVTEGEQIRKVGAWPVRLLAAPTLLVATACATGLPAEPIGAQVLDSETSQPLQGVTIVGQWIGTVGGFGHSSTRCYHVNVSSSDAGGKFSLQGAEDERKYAHGDHYTRLYSYSDGYRGLDGFYTVEQPAPKTHLLQRYVGSANERLEYLIRLHGLLACGAQDGSEKNLLPVYKLLYREALSIASGPEEKKKAERIRFSIDSLKLGFPEAQKRLMQGEYSK